VRGGFFVSKIVVLLLFYSVFIIEVLGGAVMPEIESIQFDKSFYHPGESVTLQVKVKGEDLEKFSMTVEVMDLEKVILEKAYPLSSSLTIKFPAPSKYPSGYGIDLYLRNKKSKNIVSRNSRSFDVLEHWIEMPRYGFLTDFSPGRISPEMTMEFLTQYHINSLQYYDWMYNYGKLVYPGKGDQYTDAWSRTHLISKNMLRRLIEAGHKKNIYSLAYVPIYAATKEIYKKHPDWALYQFVNETWKPVEFENKLIIMAPDNKGWSSFLIDECKKAIKEIGFDGIHLDQYGYPKDNVSTKIVGKEYKPYTTSKGFVRFIDKLKSSISPQVVFFNCVDNWPGKIVQSESEEDVVYIEPWESCNTYNDMYNMIMKAKKYSNNKPIILAAYIKHFFENSIFYSNALILSSGAHRLELGEYDLLLDGPYFPGDAYPMDDNFMGKMLAYYDFSVRYEQLFYSNTFKIIDLQNQISSKFPLSNYPEPKKIWLNVRKDTKSRITMFNLVNFLNINYSFWRNWQPEPEKVNDFTLEISGQLAKSLKGYSFYFASADGNLRMIPISAIHNGEIITLKLPFLEYWSTIFAIPKSN